MRTWSQPLLIAVTCLSVGTLMGTLMPKAQAQDSSTELVRHSPLQMELLCKTFQVTRQHAIDNDNVVRALRRQGETIAAVGGGFKRMAFCRQSIADEGGQTLVIFHQEDFHGPRVPRSLDLNASG